MSFLVPHDVLTAVVELGITVTREDDQEVTGLCPMHESRTGKADSDPSWSCNKETGFHNCFSCKYGGTFQDLVMDLECPNDVFGARKWIRHHGVRIIDVADLPDYIKTDTEGNVLAERRVLSEASLSVFFRPPADRLAERRISEDAANVYDVLWDANEVGWIIPIRDKDHVLRGWQFKSKRKFLNVPDFVPKSHCLFGYELLQPGDTAFVVESPLDAPRTWDVGSDLVVPLSTYGAAISDEQMRLILQRTDKIMFGLDNDRDGVFHTRRIARGGLDKHGAVMRGWYPRFKEMTVFNYPSLRNKDPGEMDDDQVRHGLENAYDAASLQPVKEKREKDDVHGRSAPLPSGSRRSNLRQGTAAGRVRDGARQDRHQHLRGGGTRRN
jgi:hypothetical protein